MKIQTIDTETTGLKGEIIETNNTRYLPVGFQAEILDVCERILHLYDTDGDRGVPYKVDTIDSPFKFKWVDRSMVEPTKPKPPVKQVSEQVRGKKAKALREAWEAKEKAFDEYEKLLKETQDESVGLTVEEGTVLEGEGHRELIISYSAPTKFYN